MYLTHLRGTSPSAGLGTSPSLRSLGSAPSGLSLEWGGGLWIYGRAELRVCALGVRIHLAHGRESVFRCILEYSNVFQNVFSYLLVPPSWARIRLYFAPHVLYFDRIRWFPDARTEIHPKYIQNTVGYTGYCIHRKPPHFS